MAIAMQMPKMGISVESCVLTKWHKKPGDTVNTGDVLFTYETDKTTVDEEAPESGVLLAVFFDEGDDVPVMQNVAVIGKKGESYSEFAPDKGQTSGSEANTGQVKGEKQAAQNTNVSAQSAGQVTGEKQAAQNTAASAQSAGQVTGEKQAAQSTSASAQSIGETGRLKISPRARALVQKTGVDAAAAIPTGAEGRIIESDITALAKAATPAAAEMAAMGGGTGIGGRFRAQDVSTQQAKAETKAESKAPAAGGYRDEKLSSVRKFIAKAMHESLSSMAQLTNNMSFDATNILAFRRQLKEKGSKSGLDGITINDIILYAVSRILTKHELINAHFYGDYIRHFENAHLGVAVDTPRGLLVPTLFNADKMSLSEMSAAAKQLINASQAGSIAPDLLKGGTFTVTNLGSLGVESFTPIINPPQTCILGVNTIKDAIRVENGEIKAYKSMTLSLTYDHRAVDGAPASRFLKDVCEALENFTLTLAI